MKVCSTDTERVRAGKWSSRFGALDTRFNQEEHVLNCFIWNNILHKFFSLLSCLLFVVVVAGGVWTVVYHIIIITTYSGTALMDPDGKSKESYLLSQKEINTRKNIYLPTRLRVMLGFHLFTIPWTAIWRKDTRRPGWTDLLLDNLFIEASMEIAAKSFALNFLSSDNDKLKQY